MIRSICLIFGILLGVHSHSQKQTVDIQAAIEDNLISCQITGAWNGFPRGYYDPSGQYFGKCMRMAFENKTADTLEILLNAGQMLMSHDTSTQNMLVTKSLKILLAEFAEVTTDIYAMCAEMHDDVPWIQKEYSLGEMADEELIRIAKAIERLDMQNMSGQGAVWSYTDDATEKDLIFYGSDSIALQNTRTILQEALVSTSYYTVQENDTEEVIQKADESEPTASSSNSINYYLLGSSILFFIGFLTYFIKYRATNKKE